MKLVDKILVNVDLENISDNQLDVAEKIASKFNSRIILLCVLPKEAKLDSLKSYIKSFADDQLNRIVSRFSYSDERIEKRIEYGNAFGIIISLSELENVNLIINSNVESDPNTQNRIDVLSEKLVRKSGKPVMIVKPGANPIPEKILCPVDFSQSSERALNNAIKVARVFKSKLFIINVFEPLSENFSRRLNIDTKEENDKLEAENRKQYDDFLSKFNFIDVDYKVSSLSGNPNELISEFASLNSIDLIFIGAAGKNYVQRILLGSVTEKVLRNLPASMIIMKAENLLDLKIESDISSIEKHLDHAAKLEEAGYYHESIEQLKTCLLINDLHLPVLNRLSELYTKLGEKEQSEYYRNKFNEILRRLWDKQIEYEIRKGLSF